MPPLVAFGRKWEIGSDDLVYPGVRNLLIRFPWLVGTIAVYWQNFDKLTCDNDGDYVRIFLYGAIGILNLMICADLLLIYNSSLGGVMDTKARRFVPLCLYIKIVLYLMELGWNSLGMYAYCRGLLSCNESPETSVVILGLIICNWMMLLFFSLFWIWQYDPLGKSKSDHAAQGGIDYEAFDHWIQHGTPVTQRSGLWEKKFRFIFCWILGEGRSEPIQHAYKEAAASFSYLFMNSNLVLSDVIAGAALLGVKTAHLRKKAMKEAYASSRFNITSSINYDPTTNSIKLPAAEDWNSIPSVLHFLNYALAIFTLPAAYTFRRGKILGALCTKTQCCNFIPGRKQYPVHAEKDNCCYWKTASVRTFVHEEDLVYASYDNADFCCPFFVALDHSTKTIVIVIRGSFSFVDFLVDFSVTPTPMGIQGLPAEFKAHRGMLKVAKIIKERLDKLNMLEKLTQSHPDYGIMLTGISLGAGVATILSMILRQEFPNVKCIAFAVPGAAVSLDVAEYCNAFVTSVVYGDELVPRLGIPSAYQALNEIQSVLYGSSTPKYQIQMGLGFSLFGIGKIKANFAEDGNIHNQALIVREGSHSTETIQERSLGNSQTNLMNEGPEYSPTELRGKSLEPFRHYPPGRILHVTQTPLFKKKHRRKEDAGCPRWEVKWADRSSFNEIIFSKRMGIDHLPFRLISALKYFSRFSSTNANDEGTDKVVIRMPDKSQ